MNEQIKQKLSDLFEYELKKQIILDDVFPVSVSLSEDGEEWFMDTDMYAESGGERKHNDYDSPLEYIAPCISCNYAMIYKLDQTMFPSYFEDDAYEIVVYAIKNYK